MLQLFGLVLALDQKYSLSSEIDYGQADQFQWQLVSASQCTGLKIKFIHIVYDIMLVSFFLK